MAEITCCLCGSEEMTHAHEDMFQCGGCGLYIKEELPTKSALKGALQWALLSACTRPGGPERRMSKADEQLQKIEKYISPGRLFDVGAASGFVMKAAQNRGWEVSGNDISISAVKWAKEHYDLDIHYHFFEDIGLESNSYNAVVLWNTLEHTHNPAQTIAHAKDILKTGGIIHIRIPEKGTLEALKKHYEDLHFYEFKMEILCEYLKSQGFVEKEIFKNWETDGVPSTDYLYQLEEE